MKWFNNMKISAKLISGFVVVALITAIVGFIGFYNMNQTDKKYTSLYQEYGVPLGDIANASINFHQIRVELRNIVIEENVEKRDAIKQKINKYYDAMNQSLDIFEDSLQTKEGKEIYAKLKVALENYKPLQDSIINDAMDGKMQEAITVIQADSSAKVVVEVMNNINELFKLKDENGKILSEQYTKESQNTNFIVIIIVVIGVALAVVLGIVISRIISKPIIKLVEVADKVAEGDLNVEIEYNTRDEIGMLAEAFRTMTDNLNEVMSNISVAAEQVSAGSTQLSDSSVALSQGATEQASSIAELSASIEEIASQTRVNAENAREANKITETTKTSAMVGNDHMKEMLNAMADINDASMNISKIIKVIDDIAFQTNILALNAAVEAARAGQHGKGFAVVAEEVRNLAARSSNAAKETTAMIEGSIKKSEGGTKIANETASALDKIVGGIADVAELIGRISIASDEQAAGIEQINQGILQVTTVVQTNSATSEESAAASEELASQAVLLEDQVARFKVRKQNKNIVSEYNPNQSHENKSRKGSDAFVEKEKNMKKINLGDQDFGKY